MKKLIAGNWKMNGSVDEARTLIADIVNMIHDKDEVLGACDFLVCPPNIHISAVRHALMPIDFVQLGAQNCASWEQGAYTGETSPKMLADFECSHVILGHSERRKLMNETSAAVNQKAEAAHAQGLKTIICVGETEDERKSGKEEHVVGYQMATSIPKSANSGNLIIAYEPVWAIGTGNTATPEDVEKMHTFIRESLSKAFDNPQDIPILYGGSMKPDNAAELLATANVDGGLIGGASLKAKDFVAIGEAALA